MMGLSGAELATTNQTREFKQAEADEAGSEYGDEDDDDGRSPLVIDHRSKPRAFNLQQHVITPPSEPEGCRRSKRQPPSGRSDDTAASQTSPPHLSHTDSIAAM